MKKYVMIALLAVLFLYRLYPEVSIVLADLTANAAFLDKHDEKYYTDMLYENLYSQIGDKDYTYLLARSVGNSSEVDWKVRNEIDAFAVIDNIDLNYLIFGSIAADGEFFESNFKIYCKKDGKVLKEFVYKSPEEDRETFIKEAAFKINLDVYELLKLEINGNSKGKLEKISDDIKNYNRQRDTKERFKNFRLTDYTGFIFSAGYALPIGDWGDLFIGIIDLETGIRIVRLPLLFESDFLKISIRPGFTFSYTLSKNQPDIVEEYLHSFAFRFPAELLFLIKDQLSINAYFELHVRLDSYYQDLYGVNKNSYGTASFGWAAGFGIEYALDKEGIFTIGLINIFDFAPYNVFYYDYKIESYLMIKFRETKKPEKIDMDSIKIKL